MPEPTPAKTPMMAQYDRLKLQYSDAILLFRLGDFYEMFKNDAIEASKILSLTLTSRNGVPMCGIPHHALLTYSPRLLEAGKKVAICEQTKLPLKGIADREVVEVLTPGTVVDESYLRSSSNNFIASIARDPQNDAQFCTSLLDVSTGELLLHSGERTPEGIRGITQRYSPREFLLQESLVNESPWLQSEINKQLMHSYPDWSYNAQDAWNKICHIMNLRNLRAYGIEENSPLLYPLKVLLEYVESNTGKRIRRINSLGILQNADCLVIDSSSQANLELIFNRNYASATLLASINQTKTSMGSRLLNDWLLRPLISEEGIVARQSHVAELYHNQSMLNACREVLSSMLDIPRLCVRIDMEKAHPKDLKAVSQSLGLYIDIQKLVQETGIAQIFQSCDLPALCRLQEFLLTFLVENPPTSIDEGGIVREGFNAELDALRSTLNDSQDLINSYLEEERERTGISQLRIKYNNIIGYFFELPKGQAKNAPAHFERRQSLSNVERYSTSELKKLAERFQSAEGDIIDLERELFLDARKKLQSDTANLYAAGAVIAQLDCLQSFAYQALIAGYTRPQIHSAQTIDIINGRHPVVEQFIERNSFTPNSLHLSTEDSFALVTGPNMAGKSTYLRQNALIVLLAQAGSFVPADEARIGIVDRIFCRVGASDNLARGESTFLVEMNETAHILRNATERSLVIMDEVGRGTSTEDGLAIAWSVCEYILSTLRAKTLFATHFHELSGIEHPQLKNFSLKVQESQGNIVFLNRVIDEPSNNSYGLYVARIAGIPAPVIAQAERILEGLQNRQGTIRKTASAHASPTQRPQSQMSLFAEQELVIEEIQGLDLNAISPLQALNTLVRMQNLLNE